MPFQDRQLTCRDCGKPFTWTAGEQEFYADKGFSHPPSRCKEHRLQRKAQINGTRMVPTRKEYEIICSNCGRPGTVPFEPKDKSTLLCADCFMNQRVVRSKGGDERVQPQSEGLPAPRESTIKKKRPKPSSLRSKV